MDLAFLPTQLMWACNHHMHMSKVTNIQHTKRAGSVVPLSIFESVTAYVESQDLQQPRNIAGSVVMIAWETHFGKGWSPCHHLLFVPFLHSQTGS